MHLPVVSGSVATSSGGGMLSPLMLDLDGDHEEEEEDGGGGGGSEVPRR